MSVQQENLSECEGQKLPQQHIFSLESILLIDSRVILNFPMVAQSPYYILYLWPNISTFTHYMYVPCSQDSSTALHWAARGGSIECVEYLLPHFGDRKFVTDTDGWTCLHYAVDGGSLPVMRYLVDQCGFNLSLRTGVSCVLKVDTMCIHQSMVAL